MATLSPQDRDALSHLLERLRQAERIARDRLPWAASLIRNDLDELRSMLVDMDRGFGVNLGRLPALLDRKRFRYLDFLIPDSREGVTAGTVGARRDRPWRQAA